MKPSDTVLGHEIQLFLVRQGATLEGLASQMEVSQEALSNLIHGRRRFRDEILVRMAQTPLFLAGCFSESRLKALRAVDEYAMRDLVLAVVELVKRGALDTLPNEFFEEIRQDLSRFVTSHREPLNKLRSVFDAFPQ